MKQVLQNLSNGSTKVAEVPCPIKKDNHALIQSTLSLISTGTEKMLVDFGKSNLIDKALSQPEKVKMVLEKIKTDGIIPTAESVFSKLDQPIALGYSNVGKIIEPNNTGFSVGDRVISNGNHAEIVRVSKNLICKIPDSVDDKTAAFTVVASIALNGIRLIDPKIGDHVVVYGLGLIGLLAVQILIANGCNVIGVDLEEEKCKLCEQYGGKSINPTKTNLQDAIDNLTEKNGADSVLITASTKSNEVIDSSANILRKRGKIVLIGVVGLELNRQTFYEKELSFQVACSYGPGRYDSSYEEKAVDYPYPYVRWTEQRNFKAVLSLMESKSIDVTNLISDSFDIEDAKNAYLSLGNKSSLGVLLNYPEKVSDKLTEKTFLIKKAPPNSNIPSVSFIGAGNYASKVLIPGFRSQGVRLNSLVTSSGLNSSHHGLKNNFNKISTDINSALENDTSAVVIATQHNLHASQTIKALDAKKNVFVEKPLAITLEELDNVYSRLEGGNGHLTVGYNRRFSPMIRILKRKCDLIETPKAFNYTINSGAIPNDSWIHDPEIGGGRIIGEVCHFIDLLRFLCGHKISSFHVEKMNEINNANNNDTVTISLKFDDGSIGSINYFSNGSKSFSKERLDVFSEGSIYQIDNFKNFYEFNSGQKKRKSLLAQDKGNKECIKQYVKFLKNGGNPPIPYDEIFEVARVTIEISNILRDR